MTKFDELKERYPNLIPVRELRANVSIIELALHYGYQLQVQKGRNRPVFRNEAHDDTIIVKNAHDASQQIYQRAGDFTDSGTVIDFIRNRMTTVFSLFNRPADHEFKKITSVLYDYLRVDPNLIAKTTKTIAEVADHTTKQAFSIELFDIRPLEAENYLNTRNISPDTISSAEFTGKIVSQVSYIDLKKGKSESYLKVQNNPHKQYMTFSNIAFPYYNGLSTDVTGLELRNDNIKLHASGSDRFSSVFISNPPPISEQFFILESAIDALSHKQLRLLRGNKAFDSVYFSTGGQLTVQQVNTISRYINSFEKSPNWQIHLAFDNDTKGHLYDLHFIQQLSATKFPLSQTVSDSKRISYMLPEQEQYQPMLEAVLNRIEDYNRQVQLQFSTESDPPTKMGIINTQLITIGNNNGQTTLDIPESIGPLSAVSTCLLELTRLDRRVKIHKSQSKDFNQELTRELNREKTKAIILGRGGGRPM